jgi:thiamine biosynthesis lipoprotein
MQDNIRYHHILDPSTGYPSHDCISVTVWANNGTDADILSTALFVLGHENGLELAERLDDVEALIFHEKDGRVMADMTSGVKGKIEL